MKVMTVKLALKIGVLFIYTAVFTCTPWLKNMLLLSHNGIVMLKNGGAIQNFIE